MDVAWIYLDEYGRVLIGPADLVAILDAPKEDHEYYGWEGESVKKESLTEEILDPLGAAGMVTVGGVLIALYTVALSLASIVDKILGNKRTKGLRFKLEQQFSGDPFEIDWS